MVEVCPRDAGAAQMGGFTYDSTIRDLAERCCDHRRFDDSTIPGAGCAGVVPRTPDTATESVVVIDHNSILVSHVVRFTAVPVGVCQALSARPDIHPLAHEIVQADVENVAHSCTGKECVLNESLLLSAADADQVPANETRLRLRVEPVGVRRGGQGVEMVISTRGCRPLDPFMTRGDFNHPVFSYLPATLLRDGVTKAPVTE